MTRREEEISRGIEKSIEIQNLRRVDFPVAVTDNIALSIKTTGALDEIYGSMAGAFAEANIILRNPPVTRNLFSYLDNLESRIGQRGDLVDTPRTCPSEYRLPDNGLIVVTPLLQERGDMDSTVSLVRQSQLVQFLDLMNDLTDSERAIVDPMWEAIVSAFSIESEIRQQI